MQFTWDKKKLLTEHGGKSQTPISHMGFTSVSATYRIV